MTPERFMEIADRLLKKHLLIGVDDSPFSNPRQAESEIRAGFRPFESINLFARECNLVRTDLDQMNPVWVDLTEADEEAVS